VILANAGNALQENGKYAEKYQDQKNKVEKAACKGVMSKDDFVPFIAPGGAGRVGQIPIIHDGGPFRVALCRKDTAFVEDKLTLR
jgi:hypothetical protein